MKHSYHRIPPTSEKANYGPDEIIDWKSPVPIGHEIIAGSFQISGNFHTTAPANPSGANISYDSTIGVHGAIAEISYGREFLSTHTERNYPRFYKMMRMATDSSYSYYAHSQEVNDMILPSDTVTRDLLRGPNNTNIVPFSIKPKFGYNRVLNKTNFDSKHGAIMISIRLARNQDFFNGAAAANVTYQLENLMLSYTTQETSGEHAPVEFSSYDWFDRLIESSFSAFSSVIPSNCYAVSGSVINNANAQLVTANHHELEQLPGLKEVEFLVNDTNNVLRFKLDNPEEIYKNFLNVYNSNDVNFIAKEVQTVIGLNMGTAMAGNKIGINIHSNPGGNNYQLHLYAHILVLE